LFCARSGAPERSQILATTNYSIFKNILKQFAVIIIFFTKVKPPQPTNPRLKKVSVSSLSNCYLV
jgi:hypothetical protein